jgi:hypothetical protein
MIKANWFKTAARLNKTAPIPENFDTVDNSKEYPEWNLARGGNDWERASSLMAFTIDPKSEHPTRIWATINYGHLKGFKNSNGESVDKKTDKEAVQWGKEATQKWLEVAKRKYDESIKSYKNGDDGAYEFSWLDACTAAIEDDEVKPYIKDWGIDKKTWVSKKA